MNRPLRIYEPEQIKSVIDFLKTEKNITDITESNGVSTITTDSLVLLADTEPIYLTVGMYITIGTINYQVLSINSDLKTFTITATGLYTELTEAPFTKTLLYTKWNLTINFMFGSRIEINGILSAQAKDPSLNLIRYPLAWLFINESRNHDNTDYDFTTQLKMSFVGLSKVEYKAQERLDYTLKPVIDPLVKLFLATITSSFFSHVFEFEYTKLTYKEYLRYFYGSSDQKQMVLESATDAIEVDLDITFQNQY